jgi:hypothetical protein
MDPAVGSRARRVAVAAASLAAVYGAGVVLLLSVLTLWTGEWVGAVRDLLEVHAVLFGVLFATAFLLLAVARRAGFAALWLLFLAFWVAWPLTRWTPVGVLAGFVFWSVVALPFYAIGALGLPSHRVLRLGRRTLALPAVVLAVWTLLLAVTLAVTPTAYLFFASALDGSFGGPPPAVLKLARAVWGPAPVLIGLEALTRLRPGGRRRGESAAPAV